jgi:4-diphosphocytidyl-2-C-methyl-D-erythritol kinase
MICFPNAKINLGLNITEKRSDGFHNIETVFYPIGWNDALEVVIRDSKQTDQNLKQEFNLHLSGLSISGNIEDNLLYKAYQIIKQTKKLPYIDVYLHKNLPMGAGLGGGSADAAFFINLLNEHLELKITKDERINIARQLGSDCAFFINNKPVYAAEKGDMFSAISVDLSRYYIVVVYPNVHSNTKEAYSLVKPQQPKQSIPEILKLPIKQWKDALVNDFEFSIFSKYPIVKEIKETLYQKGALYACMSGSGSAVFGIFENEIDLNADFNFPIWSGKMM